MPPGSRALQPGQEELHILARVLRGPQAPLHVSAALAQYTLNALLSVVDIIYICSCRMYNVQNGHSLFLPDYLIYVNKYMIMIQMFELIKKKS